MYDVVIVGYGPAGEFSASLLGQRDHRVLVLEKSDSRVYPLPRAVAMDAEVLRSTQLIGIAEPLAAQMRILRGAEFVNSKGERIMGFDTPSATPLGWAASYMYHQPELDTLLRSNVEQFANVEVRYQKEVTGFEQVGDRVVIEYRGAEGEAESVEARYLLGCDGAASFVRRHGDFGSENLGYDQDWLVVDLIRRREVDLPEMAQQICDPERRVTFIPAVGDRSRFEFQLKVGETREEMVEEQKVYELLSPWLSKEDAEIERAVVYRFHATLAARWRKGRCFLLGDAAHQMPPFNGQGLCSGARDAVNLCWKLDLVLRGLGKDELLDSYESERKAHAADTVDHSVMAGKLIDAFAAAEAGEDGPAQEQARSGWGGERKPPKLGSGLLVESGDGLVGRPCPQPWLVSGDGRHRLDDSMGSGFAILARSDPEPWLSAASKDLFQRIGGRLVILPDGSCEPDVLAPVFESYDAIVVRPDRYVFAVTGAAELESALSVLRVALD